ncbi:hypothetical protein ACWX0K_19085 [Nitrobacteraceae bacterium UC4446_H13]
MGGGTFRAAAQIGRHCLPQRGRNVLTAPETPVNPPKQHDFRIMVRIAAGSTLHRLAAAHNDPHARSHARCRCKTPLLKTVMAESWGRWIISSSN